jgi:hypothetical protein
MPISPDSTHYVDAFNALVPLNLEQRGRALAAVRIFLSAADSPRRRRSQRGPNRFLETEIRRAIRAVTDMGATVERVEVDPASGRISVIVASPGQGETPTPGAAAWDRATETELSKSKAKAKRAPSR